MRIVKETAYEDMKVTFFQNDGKYSVKFEKRQMEKTFKFRELPADLKIENIFDQIDELQLKEISNELNKMAHRQIKWISNSLEAQDFKFPEII